MKTLNTRRITFGTLIGAFLWLGSARADPPNESESHGAESAQRSKIPSSSPNPTSPQDPQLKGAEAEHTAQAPDHLDLRRSELLSLRAKLATALALPPASAHRSGQIDRAYSSIRTIVSLLRKDRAKIMIALETATTERDAKLAAVGSLEAGADPQFADASTLIQDTHHARVHAIELEADQVSDLLLNARNLRRNAQAHASEEARELAHASRLVDVGAEVRSIPLDIESGIRRTVDTWWKAPDQLDQVQALGGLFLGLLKLAILLVFGMWAHGHIPRWVQRALVGLKPETEETHWRSTNQFPSWIVAGDLPAMGPVLSTVIRDVLVLGISFMVFIWLQQSATVLAWVALIFAAGGSVRLAQGLIELALITPSESRPGLKVTEGQVREALLWVAKVFGLLFAIEIVVNHMLVHILAADRVSELLSEVVDLVSFGLVVVGLIRWSEALRRRVEAGGTESILARWIVGSGANPATRFFGSALALLLLCWRIVSGLAQSLIETRAGLSWLSAALARRQLRDDVQARPPLPLETRNAIGKEALRSLHMDDTLSKVNAYFQGWRQDPRRGLVAITGDRGSGKSVAMERLADTLEGPHISASAPIGATCERTALLWLISVTEIDAQPNTESVVEALNQKPTCTILLSNIHRLYLRAVGHYAGLDTVLAVMQATGRQHFWVTSLHGPAWSFLAGMEHVGNVGVFSVQLHLGQMSPADMSAWLLGQTRSAGFAPRFDGLLQRPARGPDRLRILERTERAYWRLLTEASQGNPTVAARLWVDGLRATETANILEVSVPRPHESHDLESLADSELFILTAIILHEDLDAPSLSQVLNMPEPTVRAACRGLEQLTLISENATGRYKVRLKWLPAVERHLRRRSFLHKS